LWKLSEFNIAEFVDSHFHLCWCSYHRNRVHDDALAAGTVDVDDNLVALYLKYYDWCHAPVLGYKENMNLSVKIHLNKGIFLLNLDFNLLFHYIYIYIYICNSLQCHKFQKEDILYNTKVMSVPQRSIALSEVYAITKEWLRLTVS
jgi:hypothetical protein